MLWIWISFILFILLLLALDLGVFHRKAHVISVKEALAWSAFWIALGLLFTFFIYFGYEHQWRGLGAHPDIIDRSAAHPLGTFNDGQSAAVKYLTGYLIEKSLSVDNIFVIILLFAWFKVPPIYQHRVLFWGIAGALIMRGVMIAIGAELIARYHWVLYLFGAFLILTAIKMLLLKPGHEAHENFVVRLVRRLFPVTTAYHQQHFLVRAGSTASHAPTIPGQQPTIDHAVAAAKPGTLMLTPLALALIMVETTDLIFAVDSIPAIFAITADPFLVFTSNVFAILGLRSLYFALAGIIDKFRYLKQALAIVLAVVGIKMLAEHWIKETFGEHFNLYLLALVAAILATGVLFSLLADRRDRKPS